MELIKGMRPQDSDYLSFCLSMNLVLTISDELNVEMLFGNIIQTITNFRFS